MTTSKRESLIGKTWFEVTTQDILDLANEERITKGIAKDFKFTSRSRKKVTQESIDSLLSLFRAAAANKDKPR